MSYLHESTLEYGDAIVIQSLAGSAKTKGSVELILTQVGFWLTDVANGAVGAFCIKASRVLASCDNSLTYTAGDFVYDSDTVPTGSVNKTSGAGRRKVGIVLKTYPTSTSEISIAFDGTLND